MPSKADFYTGIGDDADWIGSIMIHGDPWRVPLEILIQVNKMTYEEAALDFIAFINGYIPDRGEAWPHPWSDSRMTDYVYMFDDRQEKVVMFQSGTSLLVDPVKIVQGYTMEESIVYYGTPAFPLMRPDTKIQTEEVIRNNGYITSAPL